MGIYSCRIYDVETNLDDTYFVRANNAHEAHEAALERVENETGTPRSDIEVLSVTRVE